jgi:hypothetical protein
VGFTIDRRARSRRAKRGLRSLLGKAPEARDVGERLARLAKRMLGGRVTDASPKRVTLALHPAAAPVRIVVLPDGELEVRADTSAVGPGYHAEVIARITPILDELEYVWDEPEADAQRAMTAWLAEQVKAGERRIGMPAEHSFVIDAAVLTAMGPRDRAWCDAVIADPMRGADAFAWWDRAPGHEERSRALLAMWHEVPWREPLDRAERQLMERVEGELRAAWRADRSLDLPWAEWAQLLEWVGEDDKRAAEIRTRAAGLVPAIGYRRFPMEVELSGGWAIELPGAFVGSWEDDGERYWATDGDRMIEFSSVTVADEHSSEALLQVAPEKHPVIARVHDEARRGRAEAYDDGEVHIVHGIMTAAPNVAILTCKGSVADEAWALATFHSLRNSD